MREWTDGGVGSEQKVLLGAVVAAWAGQARWGRWVPWHKAMRDRETDSKGRQGASGCRAKNAQRVRFGQNAVLEGRVAHADFRTTGNPLIATHP